KKLNNIKIKDKFNNCDKNKIQNIDVINLVSDCESENSSGTKYSINNKNNKNSGKKRNFSEMGNSQTNNTTNNNINNNDKNKIINKRRKLNNEINPNMLSSINNLPQFSKQTDTNNSKNNIN